MADAVYSIDFVGSIYCGKPPGWAWRKAATTGFELFLLQVSPVWLSCRARYAITEFHVVQYLQHCWH